MSGTSASVCADRRVTKTLVGDRLGLLDVFVIFLAGD